MIGKKAIVDVIVAAAGKGTRMNSEKNKMFLNIQGVPVLYRTLFRLNKLKHVRRIAVVISREEGREFEEMVKNYGQIPKLVKILWGGSERSDSVRNGLRFIQEGLCSDLVMVHDGARPFFSDDLIADLTDGASKSGIAVPVLKIYETIRQKTKNNHSRVVDRNDLFITQTPQVFQSRLIKKSFFSGETIKQKLTDEASYFEKLGFEISMVKGEKWNIKITTKEDLKWSECLLKYHEELQIFDCDKK